MSSRKILMATAAAALFVASAGHAMAADDAKVKCDGANACKGKSSCKGAENSCAGKNACKGKGFLMVSDAECKEAKAKAESEKPK
jgi:hypothetical protein